MSQESHLEWSGVRQYWRENLSRSWRSWESRNALAGLGVVLMVAAGFGAFADRPEVVRIAAAAGVTYLGGLVFFYTPMRMWLETRRSIADYEARLRPDLGFRIDIGRPPYLHVFQITEDVDIGYGRLRRNTYDLRMCRVGMLNESDARIESARVVLEAAQQWVGDELLQHTPSQSPLIGHALNVMGVDTKTGLVDLAPGDAPTAYVDVAQQLRLKGDEYRETFSFCYATGHRVELPIGDRWEFVLRAEGGGTYCRARFELVRPEADRSIEIRHLGPA